MLNKDDMKIIEFNLRLADAANGGAVYDRANCECDPSVGSTCRYCAVFHGLRDAWKLLTALEESQKNLRDIAAGLGNVGDKLRQLL